MFFNLKKSLKKINFLKPFLEMAVWLMPFMVLVAVFGMCAIIYLIDFVIKRIIKNRRYKIEIKDEKAEVNEVKVEDKN